MCCCCLFPFQVSPKKADDLHVFVLFCRYCHACNTMSYIRKSLCANSHCDLWHGRVGGPQIGSKKRNKGRKRKQPGT